jgi:hypothetical protein
MRHCFLIYRSLCLWLISEWFMCGEIQGYSGRKVIILGGNSIGHCEKKRYMNMRLIMNAYRCRAFGIYKYKSIVNGNKEEPFVLI